MNPATPRHFFKYLSLGGDAATRARLLLKVYYSDITPSMVKIKLPTATGSGGYALFSQEYDVIGTVDQIRVVIQFTSKTGKLWIDPVSLKRTTVNELPAFRN